MDSYTYWISFVVNVNFRQKFASGAFIFYHPLDTEEQVMMAAEQIEKQRELPQGSITVWSWQRIS